MQGRLVKVKQDIVAMDSNIAAILIQALWRGYCSRKGKIMPCGGCGYPMTLDGARIPYYPPCSWCQVDHDAISFLAHYNSCERVGCRKCDEYYEERFIPCCICGGNCADGDYESWRFCTRRCMVEAGRD